MLQFLQALNQTPPEQLTSPPEKNKVTDRTISEEYRIPTVIQLQSLLKLQDEVHHTRSVQFHWDMNSMIQLNSNLASQLPPSTEVPSSYLSYKLQSFVWENTDIDSEYKVYFWIVQVIDVHYVQLKVIIDVTVHWYAFYNSSNIYTSRYRPSMVRASTTTELLPWVTKVHVDTIFCTFHRLTSPIVSQQALKYICVTL